MLDLLPKGTSVPTTLPRELLKWLGALDLSTPIKLPKRSFANGYIIAEILHKYYPKEVPIYGMETGSSKRSRITNWTLLEKIFIVRSNAPEWRCNEKKGINISRTFIERTIEEIPGAAEEVLQQIYMHVAKKSLTSLPSSKESTYDSNAPVRIAAPLKPKPGEQVVTTGAAAVLLSLEEIPSRAILIWELVYSITNIGDWSLVHQEDTLYNLNSIMEKLMKKNVEIAVSLKTDSRCNLVRFFNFLFNPFLFDVDSFSFRLAVKMLSHLVPMLCQSQPQPGYILLEALEPYSPLKELEFLELKLGYLSQLFGLVLEASEVSLLQFFKHSLPVDIYVYFLAGLHTYKNSDFWFAEVQSLVLSLMEGNPTIHETQLHNGILLLIASLLRSPWNIFTSTMEVYLSKVLLDLEKEKEETKLYCLAEVACVMLKKPTSSSSKHWYACIGAVRQLRDSSMLISLIQQLLPLLPTHPCLAGSIVRLISQLPPELLATVLRTEFLVQPVPYLAPKLMGAWSKLLRGEVQETLSLGLAAVAHQVPLIHLVSLLPYLITEVWTTNVMLLNSAWIFLLEKIDPHSWQLLQLMCNKIPSSHTLDKSLVFGVMATLAHHMRHKPNSPWLRLAVRELLHSNASPSSHQTLWHALCHRLQELWSIILPHYDLHQWAKQTQENLTSNTV